MVGKGGWLGWGTWNFSWMAGKVLLDLHSVHFKIIHLMCFSLIYNLKINCLAQCLEQNHAVYVNYHRKISLQMLMWTLFYYFVLIVRENRSVSSRCLSLKKKWSNSWIKHCNASQSSNAYSLNAKLCSM